AHRADDAARPAVLDLPALGDLAPGDARQDVSLAAAMDPARSHLATPDARGDRLGGRRLRRAQRRRMGCAREGLGAQPARAGTRGAARCAGHATWREYPTAAPPEDHRRLDD